MKINQASQTITASAFIVLGLSLIGTVINLFQSSSIYSFVIPLVLVFSGYTLLDETKTNQRKNIGFGLIAVGIIALLVRYDVLQGDLVNILLGLTLLTWGVITLTRIYGKTTP